MVGEGIEVVAEGEAFSILLIYLGESSSNTKLGQAKTLCHGRISLQIFPGTPMEKMETMADSHSKILALRPG